MKRRLPIEALLKWAYRDELPKDGATSFLRPDGFGFGWGSVAKHGELLADVQEPDVRNRFGLAPDFTALRGPHDDAVRIWQSVQYVGGLTVEFEEDWNPLADFPKLAHRLDEFIERGLGKVSCSIPVMIQRQAVLGKAPDWRSEDPKLLTIKATNGRPQWFIKEQMQDGSEVETKGGLDTKTRLPKAGAYLKHYYEPKPSDVVARRAEYQIYISALEAVVDDLAGRLDDYEPTKEGLSYYPWMDAPAPKPAVLPSRLPPVRIIRDPAPLAGPPPRRGKHGPVKVIDRPDSEKAA